MLHVHFPFDQLLDETKMDKTDFFRDKERIREHDAKNLIRLLTRLLFVWFIKEKGLIPEALFEKEKLETEWLNDFDAKSKDTCYYKAILQNLFFAALNQPVEKRQFRNDGRQHRNITNLMRYESLFRDPTAFVELLKSVVPFMNGGLFECLDKPHPTLKGPQGGDVILYEDGFSDHKDNVLRVPDDLFFGDPKTIDLSGVYGDTKRKKETVRGIIPILNSYKFTIVENTPIEQEIALDPELLGKVFENLLASYNPETKTTARKQTGSFYTPRTIVDYMVDESLKAYLKKSLTITAGGDRGSMSDTDAEEGLAILFAYTEQEHAFTEAEKHVLINAIDNCKILDPACGSGAFPMGILHKLEFVLSKLDPKNKLWRDRQLEKVDATIAAAENIDDTTVRENTIADLEAQKRDIEESFANNELGYGRKLYLIENCIYGVDIQAIATQVSRLRFFISLIVDQKVNAQKDNFGIRPLPNLEAKFATADTLIKIEKPEDKDELYFGSDKLKALENELKQVRHKMFGAKTPKTKNKYRERDKELREEIAEELQANGWSNASAKQLAVWDPYDQNATCSFFDPEWMFDLTGFDIVIGNPPYIQIQKFPKEQKDKWIAQNFQTYAATADIYCLFYERGAQLLREGGHLCYITSNKWMRAGYGAHLRNYFSEQINPCKFIDFGGVLIFNSATVDSCVLLLQNAKRAKGDVDACFVGLDYLALNDLQTYFESNKVSFTASGNEWIVLSPERYCIKQAVETQGIPLEKWDIQINYGIKTGFNDAFYLTQEQRDELIAKEPHAAELIVPLLRGRYVERYGTAWEGEWMINTHNGVKDLSIPRINVQHDYPEVFAHLKQWESQLKKRQDKGDHWSNLRNCAYIEEFRKPKIIYPNMTKYLPFYYDEQGELFTNQKCFIMLGDGQPLAYLTAMFNSSLFKCSYMDNFPNLGQDRRELSKIFFEKIPIRKPTDSEAALFEQLVAMVQTAKRENLDVEAAFLEELIDACVLELYFPDEAKKRNLLFIDQVSGLLESCPSCKSRQKNISDIEYFVSTVNAPTHPIRNQLLRLTADSPDLFAVIKQEGRV